MLAWTVWTPEYHERAREALAEAGNVLDANPTAMIADLSEIEPPRAGDPEPDPGPQRRGPGHDQRPGLRHRRLVPAPARRRRRLEPDARVHRPRGRAAGGVGGHPGPRRRLQRLVGGGRARGARPRPGRRADAPRAGGRPRARLRGHDAPGHQGRPADLRAARLPARWARSRCGSAAARPGAPRRARLAPRT